MKMPLLLFALFAVTTAIADTPITTREGLEAIADNLSGSYTLGADIDLDGADWTPLGNDSAPFTGTLHGNGHAIRNLVCTNNPSANSCRGLFGCTSNATINCISVSGTVAGKQYVGGFVGQANGSGRISNSYYDTSANGQMEASGTSSPRGSAAYAGVTPLDADDMTDKANFPADE